MSIEWPVWVAWRHPRAPSPGPGRALWLDVSTPSISVMTCWAHGRAELVNTKHLYNICTMLDQHRRRWADVVQMLYKCFVLATELVKIPASSQARTLFWHTVGPPSSTLSAGPAPILRPNPSRTHLFVLLFSLLRIWIVITIHSWGIQCPNIILETSDSNESPDHTYWDGWWHFKFNSNYVTWCMP